MAVNGMLQDSLRPYEEQHQGGGHHQGPYETRRKQNLSVRVDRHRDGVILTKVVQEDRVGFEIEQERSETHNHEIGSLHVFD